MLFPWLPTDPDWIADCMKYRGVVLTGVYSHWCPDWDGLPIDETCGTPDHRMGEWPCACTGQLLRTWKAREA
jgi:hypothetical protein